MLSSARVLRSRVADYDDFANSLREIDKRDDVIATVWQGKLHFCISTAAQLRLFALANGNWFCA